MEDQDAVAAGQTDEETAVVALESTDANDDDLGDAGGYTDAMRGQR